MSELRKYHAREVAALLYDRDAEISQLQAENDKLQAVVAMLQTERYNLLKDMQRIYDSCSDTDLIIDIADAALEADIGN